MQIAVTAVVLFHAFPQHLTGGFIGVDVFFVISGYLITQIIYSEITKGTYSLLGFYHRRIRRLLPALTVVLATSLVVGSLLLLPVEVRALNISSLATLLFTSNIYFWRQTGYFAPNSDTLPLLHTWSLAVEEQFYIAFPFFLYGLHRWARPHLRAVVLAATILSFVFCIWATFYKPGAAFYLAPFRAWELLVGSLLALSWKNVRLGRVALEALQITGLGLIIAGVVLVDKSTPFPAIGALPAVVGAATLIAASDELKTTMVTRFLSCSPMVGIGLISYPLYLWHWPALVFARAAADGALKLPQTLVVVVASLCLSFATYRLVEMPVRQRRVLASKKSLFVAAATVVAAIGVFNVSLIVSDGFLFPVSQGVRAQIQKNRHAAEEPILGENRVSADCLSVLVAAGPLGFFERSRCRTLRSAFASWARLTGRITPSPVLYLYDDAPTVTRRDTKSVGLPSRPSWCEETLFRWTSRPTERSRISRCRSRSVISRTMCPASSRSMAPRRSPSLRFWNSPGAGIPRTFTPTRRRQRAARSRG